MIQLQFFLGSSNTNCFELLIFEKPLFQVQQRQFDFFEANLIFQNFVFRNQYRAGVKTAEDKHKTTLDFFENIAANPYTFCLRGAGNYSGRFYETLAMGRIPFVVATDFKLPLVEIVNWEEHCVLATDTNICETLIDFHQKTTADDLEKIQVKNRNLWLQFLSREAYFTTLSILFKEKI